MAFATSPERPAWQTEDLDEEWIENDDEDDDNLSNDTRSLSLTAPLATFIQTNSVLENELSQATPSNYGKGTFVVHQSVNHAPLVHQTPGGGLGVKKTNMKNIFSPMPLERMFDPPSPVDLPKPSVPIILESPPPDASTTIPDEIVETDLPQTKSLSSRKFTFSAPRPDFLDPGMNSPAYPMAESTPTPASNAPHGNSEPPLRLFQFQYDTYTREHLSAMVDSIAVNTPSGSTPSPVTFTHGLSKVSENTPEQSMLTDLRSAKRVKLSPVSDYQTGGVGDNAIISRPRLYGKEYVGASYSLMQAIKERDYSTISTVVSAQTGTPDVSKKAMSALQSSGRKVLGSNNSDSPEVAAAKAKANGWSSSRFRQDAAALMAQIKDDMKGKKRVFSTDSQTSFSTVCEENEPPAVSSSLHSSDENSFRPNISRSSSRTSSLGSIRNARSPYMSPAQSYSRHSTDRELSGQFSRLSMSSQEIPRLEVTEPTRQAGELPPPRRPSSAPSSHPTSSVRLRTEDMNRFVSSSTASGTTLTSGSTQSFAKHPGPAQIRTIAPSDLPSMPDQMGGMMFDKVMMKWVKTTARATETPMDDYLPPEEHSEDPFEDIESLRDESRAAEFSVPAVELSRVEEQTEMDEEEAALTSFETDEPSMANIVEVMTGIESGNDTFDSDSFNDQEQEPEPLFDMNDESWLPEPSAEEHPGALGIPGMASPASSHTASPSRGALVSATPIKSVLKGNASVVMKEQESRYQTPLSHGQGHRRSVSFSDGKRDGPIRGLRKVGMDSPSSQGSSPGSGDGSPSSRASSAGGGTPSVRSKRLADMMQALQDPDGDTGPQTGNDSTVSLLQPSPRIVTSSPGGPTRKRVFSRSQSMRASPSVNNTNNANATFLTECSFGVAHDRLVQVITDIEPFEPHWEDLVSVDLSNRNIDSVARLKEFLPKLDSLNLNSNQVSWLSGIPSTLRTLSVASNMISSVTSFHHLKSLESLDISRNNIDSLRQLSCLRHLRELRADGNRIMDLEGLENMQGLMKLSLKGNAIRSADLEQYKWTALEMLTLSENGLTELSSLASLRSLVILILDDNSLDHLEIEKTMPKLKVLRLSGNKVGKLDVARVPNLRTLYLDNNSLTKMDNISQLTKMENLSLRNQAGRGFNLVTRDIRDVKRLYLSGNPLGSRFLAEACYNLVYVELAACRLSVLPDDLARLIPNVRVLNLNYNFLEDVRPLEGLTRLEKLTVIGSRLKGTKALIRLLEKLPDVEMVDLRMNPCTLGWYLPLLVKDLPGALQPSEQGDAGSRHSGWQELDAKFRRDLPDDVYVGRLVYRGMVMRACRRLRLLDGVEVSEKERAKAEKLLVGIRSRHRGSD